MQHRGTLGFEKIGRSHLISKSSYIKIACEWNSVDRVLIALIHFDI